MKCVEVEVSFFGRVKVVMPPRNPAMINYMESEVLVKESITNALEGDGLRVLEVETEGTSFSPTDHYEGGAEL